MHIMVVMTATTSKRGQIKPALHLNFVSLQSLSQSLDTKMESKKCWEKNVLAKYFVAPHPVLEKLSISLGLNMEETE